MKKTLSVVLAVIMMFAMCVPAIAGAQMDALTNPMQKAIAALIQQQYDESTKPDKKGALSTSTTPAYIGNNIAGKIDLKTIDLTTLEADVDAAFTAAFEDLDPIDVKGNKFSEQANKDFRSRTATEITNTLIKSGILLALTKVSSLNGYQASIANLVIEAVNKNSLDAKTAEGQSKIAEYVVANIDIDGYYNDVYVEDEEKVQVVNDCKAALGAVWTDNSALLTEGVDSATTAVSNALNTKLAEIDKNNGGGAPGSISEWLEKIFSNFTDGDFNEMFNGFGDAIKKIGASLSDLLGGLFGGGSDNNTTTTKKPSSSSNGTDSIPKTGDVALYSVAALSVVAGIALVLTKKKKDDK